MEYISAEEFLKQDKEVQNVFLDWWEPTEGDLFRRKDLESGYSIECLHYVINNKVIIAHSQIENKKEDIIPLLLEGQLRKFIEDKINSKIEIVFVDKEGVENEESYYRIERVHYLDGNLKNSAWLTGKTDLLQAYWKVATQIAKECIANE